MNTKKCVVCGKDYITNKCNSCKEIDIKATQERLDKLYFLLRDEISFGNMGLIYDVVELEILLERLKNK
jgi:hypothetical protein